jgi:hypothetical protein
VVGSSGLAGVRTIVLLTPDDVDAASTMHSTYRPPGA